LSLLLLLVVVVTITSSTITTTTATTTATNKYPSIYCMKTWRLLPAFIEGFYIINTNDNQQVSF